MQGEPWDWHRASHRRLDGQLLNVLAQMHALGVVHNDLNKGNILVTENGIMLLDFAYSQRQASMADRDDEQNYMITLLEMGVRVMPNCHVATPRLAQKTVCTLDQTCRTSSMSD